MDVAATLGLLGVPASRYIDSTDPDERLLLRAIARRAMQLDEVRQRNQATLTINALGKAMR